jgi:hypothetical protein
MTKYIVNLYREMRLSYTDIEADTPYAAAAIAGGRLTADADNIEDCEGENLAALVDVAGDEDFSQSVTIDFEPERHRKAAPKLLEALKLCHEQLSLWVADTETCDLSPEDEEALAKASYAIAEAEAAGIIPALRGIEGNAMPLAGDAANVRYVIHSDAEAGYWSNETGWGCLAEANVFTAAEREAFHLPMGDAQWAVFRPYSVLLLYPDYIGDYGTETYYAFVAASDPIDAVAVAQRHAAGAQIIDIDDATEFAPLLVTEGLHAGQPLFNK